MKALRLWLIVIFAVLMASCEKNEDTRPISDKDSDEVTAPE
jgi:hypothetical protein